MTAYFYNKMWNLYEEMIPVDSIYNETRRGMFNIMNSMTSKILNTTGFIDAQYCHVVTTNKESLKKMLTEEQNPFKREKLAAAIANLDAPVVAEMIEAWDKEQQDITALVTTVATAVVSSTASAATGAAAASLGVPQ